MVNNMLELARIEAGRMQLVHEPVDVADLLGMVRSNLSYLALKKQVTVTYNVERDTPVLLTGSEALRRILENLVSNAIKFVEVNGLVEVKASYAHSTKMLTLTVRDNGCGISEQDLPFVFDRFEQGSVLNLTEPGKTQHADKKEGDYNRNSGSGLGLALVKELVELYDGQVNVQSEVGRGSLFTIEIKAEALELDDEDIIR
jgi:signal transduction histidine kinase